MYRFSEETSSLFDELCRDVNCRQTFIGIPCRCCARSDIRHCDGNSHLEATPANTGDWSSGDVVIEAAACGSMEEQMEIGEDHHKTREEKGREEHVDVRHDGADVNESYICFKDILHSEFDEDAIEPFMKLFSDDGVTSGGMEQMCRQLELSALPIDGVVKVGLKYLNSIESVSYNQCVCFIRHCLLPKAIDSRKNLPQNFISLITAFLHKHQSPTVDGLFLAMFQHENFDSPQADLIIKATKDEAVQLKLQLLGLLIGLPWKKAHVVVLEYLIKSKVAMEMSTNMTSRLCHQIATASQAMSDNLKFGKLVLEVINKYGKQLSRDDVEELRSAMVPHKTFMKKSVDAALKKLTN